MRGKVGLIVAGIAALRITPAYAGKRISIADNYCLDRDHPRLCGEKADFILSAGNCSGSPPPMRGKEDLDTDKPTRHRITPAYAGKSVIPTAAVRGVLDHPRLCGEKAVQRGDITGMSGSPPPMRGKAMGLNLQKSNKRITPAYAGKSYALPRCPPMWLDHPRLCGEKFRADSYINRNSGITPAYAGKSRIPITQLLDVQDHPRLCGEKFRIHSFITCQPGSPPPMRGKVSM